LGLGEGDQALVLEALRIYRGIERARRLEREAPSRLVGRNGSSQGSELFLVSGFEGGTCPKDRSESLAPVDGSKDGARFLDASFGASRESIVEGGLRRGRRVILECRSSIVVLRRRLA
jgi:hypothetical protein